jgi:alpha-D-ribose 1-methylphosphonate 5-triphosphate synthase subunit PhnG
MRFLPDSAILGTLGHIKHATKKKKKGRAVSEVDAFVQHTDLTQDVRSFEELLIQAREHAKKKENAN